MEGPTDSSFHSLPGDRLTCYYDQANSCGSFCMYNENPASPYYGKAGQMMSAIVLESHAGFGRCVLIFSTQDDFHKTHIDQYCAPWYNSVISWYEHELWMVH